MNVLKLLRSFLCRKWLSRRRRRLRHCRMLPHRNRDGFAVRGVILGSGGVLYGIVNRTRRRLAGLCPAC